MPEHAADDATRAADRILSGPAFREPEPSLLERARDWLFEQLARLFADVLEGATGSPVAWVVAALVTAALAFIVVRAIRGVTPDPERDAVRAASRRPSVDWRAEAVALEARGEWRGALQCRYRALVADLAARGLVEEIPGRTAGAYRREVEDHAPQAVATAFAGATELFERVWYGGAPAGRDEAHHLRELEQRVLAHQ